MKVKSEREDAQSCPTPSDPMDYSPPGSPIHGTFQARVLEWGAIAFSEYIVRIPLNIAYNIIDLPCYVKFQFNLSLDISKSCVCVFISM